MELTPEQHAIILSKGDIRINAVAGSGKTTTIIEYAKAQPRKSRILYLAFNRSVKLEAARKFARHGLPNVQVETAHSLAYKYVVAGTNRKVRPQGYKTSEIAGILRLRGREKHEELVIANHISRLVAYYCNSDLPRIQDIHYPDIVTDPRAKSLVEKRHRYIEEQAARLIALMEAGTIEMTHDFYLKQFQLRQPDLPYDYLLFDEGQDASPAMLAVFLGQKATKVIVGDTHQQIYGWRYAVNSLERAPFGTHRLSTSFRFSQDIADLAAGVLQWKAHLETYAPVRIFGHGDGRSYETKAVLARTNLGLLLKAIEYVIEKGTVERVYFEGNIHSYTYAEDGASLYDVLNLYNGRRHLIRDKLIGSMYSMTELNDYISKTDDMQLAMMVDIVKQYGNRIPEILRTIKEKHVPDDQKETAQMIFSTIHRSKGMEYDAILLVDDFITEHKILQLKEEARLEQSAIARIREEINLLYVAITRTRNSIHIPAALLPKGFCNSSRRIHVIGLPPEEPIRTIPDSKRTVAAARTT